MARNDFEFIDESNIHQPLFKELNQTNYMSNKDGINDTNCKYRSMEWHSKNFVNASSNLSIIHFNTRSLNKNLNKIEELLNLLRIKPGVIAISESKLNDTNLQHVLLTDYTILHTNSLSCAGGAALNKSNNLQFSKMEHLSSANSHSEYLFVEVKTDSSSKKKDLVIGTIYRHPVANIQDFQDEFCRTIFTLAASKKTS